MGSSFYPFYPYNYNYSDRSNTDMNKITKNENKNEDFDKINQMMENENKEEQKDLKLEKTFKFLKVQKVYLGFNFAREIYERYKKEFKQKGLSKRDASHPSLFFDFGEGCSYYVDYLPDKGESKTAKFVYGNNYGLRYAEKNFKDFVKHNDTVIITLKTKEITFYDYFIEICKNGRWTKSAHNYETNNCNHFIHKSLQILDAKLVNDNDFQKNFLFSTEINSSKKDAIKEKIPFLFHEILGINY